DDLVAVGRERLLDLAELPAGAPEAQRPDGEIALDIHLREALDGNRAVGHAETLQPVADRPAGGGGPGRDQQARKHAVPSDSHSSLVLFPVRRQRPARLGAPWPPSGGNTRRPINAIVRAPDDNRGAGCGVFARVPPHGRPRHALLRGQRGGGRRRAQWQSGTSCSTYTSNAMSRTAVLTSESVYDFAFHSLATSRRRATTGAFSRVTRQASTPSRRDASLRENFFHSGRRSSSCSSTLSCTRTSHPPVRSATSASVRLGCTISTAPWRSWTSPTWPPPAATQAVRPRKSSQR